MYRQFSARHVVVVAVAVAGFRARPALAQVTFTINQAAGHAAISSLIYGINTNNVSGVANPGLNQSAYAKLNLTFERLGGDRFTAYNWTNNASNAGADYEYENDNYLGGGSTPGGAVLPFLQGAQGAGALVTVPINGYVAADENGPVNLSTQTAPSSRFVPEYPTPAQDPSPASNHVYQNQFVQFVENNFTASAGRPLVFDLDNEPDLWSSSHPEVHPAATTYAELLSKTIAYATMIKSVDPSALVYGPVSYGWDGYTTLQDAPDSAADGDFVNYYLKNMAAASATAGVRLIDALDLHWYPEATGANASGQQTRIIDDDTSPGVVAARLQAPRSLWDPTYSENSYISNPYSEGGEQVGPIQLIPRMQAKIAANYPGTKLSFGEYNYGAGDSISGGIAEADVLGIFGKYGVYSANEWPLLGDESFIAGAFQMFRNYDGKDSTFGDTTVQTTNSDTVDTSVYASVDSTNPDHLTLVAINKESSAVTATLNISNGGIYKTAGIYQLTSGSSSPVFVGNVAITNPASFTYSMPADSVSTITLLSNQWLLSSGASWSSSTSWSAGIPNGQAAVANFLAAPSGITSPATITLDGHQTVGQISFNNTNTYAIAAGTGGTLTIDDSGDAAGVNPLISVAAGNHVITAPMSLVNGVTITTAISAGLTINGNITGAGGVTVAGTGMVTLGGADSFGNITVNSGAALLVSGSLGSASTLTDNGKTTLAAGQSTGILTRTFAGISIGTGGQLTVANATVHANRTLLITATPTLTGTAQLDLNNNDMDIPAGNLATLTADIKSGFDGGDWKGAGITSSAASSNHLTALGIMLNGNTYGSAGALGLFDGINPASTDVLIKYTYFGDANLDGAVDGSDYSLIDHGFTAHLTGWSNGDFNYDGIVDGSDYTLIDNAFNTQAGSLTTTAQIASGFASTAAVPEPASGWTVIATAGWLAARCRRSSFRTC